MHRYQSVDQASGRVEHHHGYSAAIAEALGSDAAYDCIDDIGDFYREGSWEMARVLRRWIGESARIIQVGNGGDPLALEHVAVAIERDGAETLYVDIDGVAAEADFLAKCTARGSHTPWIGDYDQALLEEVGLKVAFNEGALYALIRTRLGAFDPERLGQPEPVVRAATPASPAVAALGVAREEPAAEKSTAPAKQRGDRARGASRVDDSQLAFAF
ncbi:hypothetical protein J2T57_001227 [Natronocella acetinitrilica]|uniref:Uncharacterized protein n=1 Tax=Natronocella acetinitrilica TaxID=414046 RepID=A0AAE3G1K2_9GAMM|nr:hypothetical protein [Natronocella acetinitrilica]MCP1674125.1 hypothetical protein [Natronocella acetinitrilica]